MAKGMVQAFTRRKFGHPRPITYGKYLADTTYSERRKQELRNLERMSIVLTPEVDYFNPDATVKLFIKNETYSEYKFARGINTRHDRSKIFMAPYVKTVEHLFYTLGCFVKHISVADRPQHVRRVLSRLHWSPLEPGAFEPGDGDLRGLKFYVTDHTAFESAMTPQIMSAFEFAVYRTLFCKDHNFCHFMKKITMGKQKIKNHLVSCTRLGGRMSGDLTTSIGNGITNLFSIEYILTSRHIPHSVVVEGDDALIAIPLRYTIRPEWWTELGFTVKLEEVKHPRESGFCGMYYSENADGTNTLMRDPRKILASTGWLDAPYDPVTAAEIMRGRALSLALECGGEPIVNAYVRYLVRTFGLGVARWRNDYWNALKLETLQVKYEFLGEYLRSRVQNEFIRAYGPVPRQARDFFNEKFHIDPHRQVEIESLLDKTEPGHLSGAWLDRLMGDSPDYSHFYAINAM